MKTAASQFDDGRARFAAVKPLTLAEPRNVRHPYSLTTGRLRDQWHGMSAHRHAGDACSATPPNRPSSCTRGTSSA